MMPSDRCQKYGCPSQATHIVYINSILPNCKIHSVPVLRICSNHMSACSYELLSKHSSWKVLLNFLGVNKMVTTTIIKQA